MKNEQLIDLPVKLLLSEAGVDFFIKNNKPMNRFTMADKTTKYGISMAKFTSRTIKHMISIGYLSRIELSRTELTSKRSEIMDLAKLSIYGFLIRRFDEMTFDRVMDSELIKNWNRTNHGNILDRKTRINETVLKKVLEDNKEIVTSVRNSLAGAVLKQVKEDSSLNNDEKKIQYELCEDYLNGVRPLTWFILSKFKDVEGYISLVQDISYILKEYMARNAISEYLSLMLMELINSAENRNLQNYIKKNHPALKYTDVLEEPETRIQILKEMENNSEKVSISLKFDTSETRIGAKKKFELAVYNKETEFLILKEKVDQSLSSGMKRSSLTEFYRSSAEEQNNELGLVYLSYLAEECSRVGIRFESQVKELGQSLQSFISLGLTI